jgi:UDP-N-acetylmuramate: L-alanyl-gamma-D-glutamyl-meso-diaminopimelate ligase
LWVHIQAHAGQDSQGAPLYRVVISDITERKQMESQSQREAALREAALEALRRFGGVKRRLEVRGVVRDIVVYDDFAHHPTAIATTLDGVRRRAGQGRVIAVLEPRSNTMKLGTHKAALATSLASADRVFIYQSPEVKWDVADAMLPLGSLATVQADLHKLVAALVAEARPGDHLVLMSNGSFGGLHEHLLRALRAAVP